MQKQGSGWGSGGTRTASGPGLGSGNRAAGPVTTGGGGRCTGSAIGRSGVFGSGG